MPTPGTPGTCGGDANGGSASGGGGGTIHGQDARATTSGGEFADLPAGLSDPRTAQAVIIPVPYDRTSTWKKGADRGPTALIEASRHLELYDIETGGDVSRRGIATLAPIVHDGGPEALADLVDERVGRVLERGRLPVVIGGEHSVSIGAIRAAARPGGVSVLQLDAHADTREQYEGSAFNHACVMARARQWCPIVQVGVRSLDAGELEALDEDRVFYAHELAAAADEGWMGRIVERLTERVYVTIDLDVFDPSLVPATGTPEPGGLGWYEVNALLHRVAAARRVVGFDVVELLPTPGQWASEFLAAKLVYRFLSEIFAARR